MLHWGVPDVDSRAQGLGVVSHIECPITNGFAIAGGYICKSGDAKVKSYALDVHEFNLLNPREVGNIFHDESVSCSLQVHPCCRFHTDVTSDAIHKFPCVCCITWVNILPYLMTRFTEDHPGCARLKLQVVN